VAETGVHSMVSFRLFLEGDTMGALNYYSRRTRAFDAEAERIGAVLAAHAAVAISGAQAAERSREAVRTRDVIGQAKGILMAREGVGEDEAFDMLRRASQRMNVKLRDVASQVARGGTRRTRPDRDRQVDGSLVALTAATSPSPSKADDSVRVAPERRRSTRASASGSSARW
jgi:hypothetical protein